jgi:predicted ribosome quality control (RQC) complex YloA/Tae2 family protein
MKIIDDYKDVTFFIGQNAKENDELFRAADPEDIWFHYDNRPSAHVYMQIDNEFNSLTKNSLTKNSPNSLSKKELLKMIKVGALLVRKNSKKTSGLVEICYLKRKFLRKGNKPGEVILTKDPVVLEI